jgi:hypothetical protein
MTIRMIYIRFLFASLILVSCSTNQTSKVDEPEFHRGKKLAEHKLKVLKEVSGLASSINNPGLLWAHNDSGNDSDIFLIDQNLSVTQRYVLAGVENRDWEDIVVGPGPDSARNYLYVAEIGDNEAVFPYKYIYRFEEPAIKTAHQQETITITEFETIIFELPDGRKDTEALLVDPKTRNLIVVSKREEPVNVYQIEYPYPINDTITAKQVATLPLTQIVAGSFSSDGNEILMKNYNHIYYWKNSSNMSLLELLKEQPKEIPYSIEPQGESITWAYDDSGFFTISEINKGKNSFLYFYKRK